MPPSAALAAPAPQLRNMLRRSFSRGLTGARPPSCSSQPAMTTVVQPPQQPSSDEHEQLLRGQDLVSSGATFAAGSHVQLSFAAAAAAAAPVQPQPRHTTALSAINESTKWVVSAAVFVVLVWQRNEHTAWCVVGAVMSSFLCKVLKYAINQQRPEQARKSDPGMPSSHANSINFLSVYAALSLRHHMHGAVGSSVLATAIILLGLFLTWLRVALGYHTWPQVLVGAALGAATATGWLHLGTTAVLPALQHHGGAKAVLFGVTGAAMAAFSVKNVLSWARERKQQAAAASAPRRQPPPPAAAAAT